MASNDDKINISSKVEINPLLEDKLVKDDMSKTQLNPYSKNIIIKKEMPIINQEEYIEKLELEISDYKSDIEQLKLKNSELNIIIIYSYFITIIIYVILFQFLLKLNLI